MASPSFNTPSLLSAKAIGWRERHLADLRGDSEQINDERGIRTEIKVVLSQRQKEQVVLGGDVVEYACPLCYVQVWLTHDTSTHTPLAHAIPLNSQWTRHKAHRLNVSPSQMEWSIYFRHNSAVIRWGVDLTPGSNDPDDAADAAMN
jgi:hypothetical protein